MTIKSALLFIVLATINTLNCSNNHIQNFKALEATFRLASKQDVQTLKKEFDANKTIESQLHDLFSPYPSDYNHCNNQKKLSNVGALSLAAYSTANIALEVQNTCNQEPSFFNIFFAIVLMKGALHMQNMRQHYDDDQKLLIQKCSDAFECDDLEKLQQFYTQTNEHDHLEFLNKVLERQKWIKEAQR